MAISMLVNLRMAKDMARELIHGHIGKAYFQDTKVVIKNTMVHLVSMLVNLKMV